MVDLAVDIGNLTLKNPVLTASGTCGYGVELSRFFNTKLLGGIIVKGITLKEKQGNEYPRMAETPSGMLNTIGLQNKGINNFINEIYPKIKHLNNQILVNVNGSSYDEYITLCKRLNEVDTIKAIELNISCPNVKRGGMSFGVNPKITEQLVKKVRKNFDKHLMVKLSPNVTDIAEIAKIVESEGADSISLINTLVGMAIDVKSQSPVLSTITGGLSGPCIKPIALSMVWKVYNTIKIPIIGSGGIMNTTDAIEFFLAGAAAIQIGTANFIDPLTSIKIINGITDYLKNNNYNRISELIGKLKI